MKFNWRSKNTGEDFTKISITFNLSVTDIARIIANDTTEDGKQIVNHMTSKVKSWSKSAIEKEVRAALLTSGINYYYGAHEDQYQAALSVVKQLFNIGE